MKEVTGMMGAMDQNSAGQCVRLRGQPEPWCDMPDRESAVLPLVYIWSLQELGRHRFHS